MRANLIEVERSRGIMIAVLLGSLAIFPSCGSSSASGTGGSTTTCDDAGDVLGSAACNNAIDAALDGNPIPTSNARDSAAE